MESILKNQKISSGEKMACRYCPDANEISTDFVQVIFVGLVVSGQGGWWERHPELLNLN